ncbi:MAG: IS66 family transposase zinc-finger binding domain-containing protein, partial [Armatimonadetes bacterium]|nr:IS66 family transposase zinc-finger binding domain-containing protein [Armatimonadota bacterium]
MISFLLKQDLKAEIDRLKGGGKPRSTSPDWAKSNTRKKPEQVDKPPRKPRETAFVRLREEPTEEVVHACSECPDCGRTLAGGSVRSRRQILELPEITVRVIEHLFLERYCGVCQKRCAPQVDLSEQAVGQSRFGPRVHSLVAYLRQVCRLPVSAIASLLS